MTANTPLELRFETGSTLEVRALVAGPHHRFKTGKVGYLCHDRFDYGGKCWRLQFQAFVMDQQTSTTHGMLEEVREESVLRVPSGFLMETKLGKWVEVTRLNRDWKEAGWKLNNVSNGIQAVFDLSRLRTYPSGKIGSFASCNVEIDRVLYLCQFHIREQYEPLPKPTEWDSRRGASAGIPTLGKRR